MQGALTENTPLRRSWLELVMVNETGDGSFALSLVDQVIWLDVPNTLSRLTSYVNNGSHDGASVTIGTHQYC